MSSTDDSTVDPLSNGISIIKNKLLEHGIQSDPFLIENDQMLNYLIGAAVDQSKLTSGVFDSLQTLNSDVGSNINFIKGHFNANSNGISDYILYFAIGDYNGWINNQQPTI